MKYKKFLGAASAALMIVIILTLVLTPSALAVSKYKTLHKFTGGKDGGAPYASLIFDQAGNLYGTTTFGGNLSCNSGYGCGVVFKLAPKAGGGWTESVLYRFNGGIDGGFPYAGLIFDQAGNLYGTTSLGGNLSCGYLGSGCGVVFTLTPNSDGSWTESVLYSFTGGSDGENPQSSLIFDSLGNLYGTTPEGGAGGRGTVFELAPKVGGGWEESVLYTFCPGAKCADGEDPLASLIFDQAGNLYGTTYAGGNSNNKGTVFTLTPNSGGSWSESVLYSFCPTKPCRDGNNPYAGLTLDPAGNLYSTTLSGGASGKGAVFKLAPTSGGSWSESVLYSFSGGEDGGGPIAGLVLDTAGNLYGSGYFGGIVDPSCVVGCGIVFKLAPNSTGKWKETVLHTFLGHPGARPRANLIFDGTGNLYGTTSGTGSGTVFEITP